MAWIVRCFLLLLPLLAPLASPATIAGHYVVELETPSMSEQFLAERGLPARTARARLTGSAGVSHRRRVHAEQQTMQTRLERSAGARVFGSVDTVSNSLFVELQGDGARAQLSSLPGVKRVIAMREFHRVMDRAVAVHKIAEAWPQSGNSNSSGEGVKVAVIDSGVEASHPALQANGLAAPAGFPRADSETDAANTNGKVIVARSYVSMLPRRDPDLSARDRVGHGTALAAIIAGVRAAGPLATVTGVAPKAWIGNYKVFGSPGVNDSASDAAILRAIDDAVNDGMDVINLSLGSDFAPRLDEDLEVQAIERATRAGVIVVVSAGNNGPGLNTLASPGTAPSAITVGAVSNDRTFASSVDVPGLGSLVAISGSGPRPAAPVTASLTDLAAIDGNGLACAALPSGSLTGAIALILRGGCSFEIKLTNAQRAGAVAALVYAAEPAPEPIGMSAGEAALPAQMVSFADGVAIKQLLGQGSRVVTLIFTTGPVSVAANRRTGFSAAGPSVDTSIKPDLVAVGSNVYTATQTLDTNGDMYSANGFVLVDGTSFSAPIVAGAAALLKGARPGLSADQYRSLIINNTADAFDRTGTRAGRQTAGSGSLDVLASLQATVTMAPASLGFGGGGADPRLRRLLTLTNLGTAEDTFFLETQVQSGTAGPVADSVRIGPGASAEVPVTWSADGLPPGTYEGFLLARSASTGIVSRVPYWYAVASPTPAAITVLSVSASGRRAGLVRDAVLFRVLDSSGLSTAGAEPVVTVVAGDGAARAAVSYDSEIPGLYGVTLQLGPAAGTNTFRIQAGEVSATVDIVGR